MPSLPGRLVRHVSNIGVVTLYKHVGNAKVFVEGSRRWNVFVVTSKECVEKFLGSPVTGRMFDTYVDYPVFAAHFFGHHGKENHPPRTAES